MGLFKGTGSAKVVKSEYIKPGEVLFRIDMCKTDKNRKKEDIVVIQGTVIHVLNPEESEMKLGDTPSQVLKPASDYFGSEVKAFICAANSQEPNDADPKEVEEALELVFESGQNPLAGTVMHLRAYEITTKEGNPFTKIEWKGEVKPEKVKETLSEAEYKRFYEN